MRRATAILTVLTCLALTPSASATGQTPEQISNTTLISQYKQLTRKVEQQRHRMSSCKHAEKAIIFYRGKVWYYQDALGERRRKTYYPERKQNACAYKRWQAGNFKAIAYEYRKEYERRVLPDTRSWTQAVHIVQRVFPGTSSWLMSCSDAEGWNASTDTTWFTHGWGRYYPGFEHKYVVGGPMQYKWPTFKGHFRRGLYYLQSRGYRVEKHLRDPGNVDAWLSMLGQAIAGGWAIGNGQRSHWFASFGRGC